MITHNRLEIFVDIFHKQNQRALVLPDITVSEFIEAILQEFKQARMEFLGDDPSEYLLVRVDDFSALEPDLPVKNQLKSGERLALVERTSPLPPGARPVTKPLYLRELSTNRVFRIQWVPAIIGRPDPTHPDNVRLAVDLRDFETGLRVSRRHAQILEKHGEFFIKALSHNPTTVQREGDPTLIPVGTSPLSIQSGDLIILNRSNIMLKVIIRDGAPMHTGTQFRSPVSKDDVPLEEDGETNAQSDSEGIVDSHTDEHDDKPTTQQH